jgi:translation initiation factor IF-3
MSRARDAGLDLVEVDANGQPPVCRILDYGKFKYEQAKRERDARKHQRGTMIHEVRLRPRTGQHDIDLKVRIARRLLDEGDKVKLSVMFRGREISHPEVGREVLDRAIEGLGETANIEKPPGMEGRFLTVILTPSAKKPEGGGKTKGEGGDAKPKTPRPEAPKGDVGAKAEAKKEESNKEAEAPKPEAKEEKEAEPAATAQKNEG